MRMPSITFTIWQSVRDARHPGEVLTKPWDEWVPEFTTHVERGPAPTPGDPNAKTLLNRAKGGRCFVPGEVAGARNANSVRAIHAAILDLDSLPDDKLTAVFTAIKDFEAVVYTTHKHGFDGSTRLRVVMPLATPVPTKRYVAFWHGLNGLIGGCNDKSTKSPQLPFYFPSTWRGSTVAEAWRQPGRWLDPGEVLPTLETPSPQPAEAAADDAAASDDAIAAALIGESSHGDATRATRLLRRMPKEHELREAATALMRGEPYADPGTRHDVTIKLTGWLAYKLPLRPFTASDINALFEPSLAAMKAADPTLDERPAEAYATALEKALDARKAEKQADEAAARVAQRRIGETEYTEAELEAIAEAQGCTVGELDRRWIIMKGTSYYLLNERGGYVGPFVKDEAQIAVHHQLSRSPIRLVDWTDKGPKDRSLKDLIKQHGNVAHALVSDFTLQRTIYDSHRAVLREAVCPLRPLEPVYNENIEEWLTLLAGPQASKLFDWMACAPDLSRLLCALYFCGSKSAGKTLFAHGMASLWTEGAPTNAAEIFASDFNEAILACPLVFADETLPKRHNGMNVTELLRGLLTTSNRKVRRKYLSTSDAAGSLRVILAANNEYLLSAPSMTADDIEAVAEKVLYIDAPGRASREYLERIREHDQEQLNRWRAHDIAAFSLWLQKNRIVEPESRFWVSGSMSTMLRNLLTTTGWNSRICEFLARFLDEPKKLESQGKGLVRILDGELLVNVRGILDGWTQYLTEPKFEVETTKVSAALRSISKGSTVKKFNGRDVRYHVVDVDNVFAWSEQHQVGEVTTMRGNLLHVVSGKADGGFTQQLNQPMKARASHGAAS